MILLDMPETLDNEESNIKLSTQMIEQGKPLIGAGSEIAFLKKLLQERVICYPNRESICPVSTSASVAEFIITQKKLNQSGIQKSYYIYDKEENDRCVGMVTVTPINANTVKVAQITTYQHSSNWNLFPLLERSLHQDGQIEHIVHEMPANTIDIGHLVMLKHQGFEQKRQVALFDETRLTFTRHAKVATQCAERPKPEARSRCA